MKALTVFAPIIFLILITSCNKEDTVAPVVQINGDAVITVTLNGTYTEAGATATDNLEGEVEVYISGEVDTDLEGIYEIEYTAIDADGNTGAATRWVTVSNEARYLSGFYSVTAINPGDTANFVAELTTSVTLNNQIWFRGFGADSTAVVFGGVENDSLKIPKQQDAAFSGRFYRGAGTIIQAGDTLKLEINYTDSLGVNVNNGVLKFLRY